MSDETKRCSCGKYLAGKCLRCDLQLAVTERDHAVADACYALELAASQLRDEAMQLERRARALRSLYPAASLDGEVKP